MKKKDEKGRLGNVVDSIASATERKKKSPEEIPTGVDSIERIAKKKSAKPRLTKEKN